MKINGSVLLDTAAALTFLLVGAGMVIAWNVYWKQQNPVEFFQASIEPKTAKPGQEVWLVLDRDRRRQCPAVAYELWVNDKGDRVQGRMVPGGGADLGRATGQFAKVIPENIAPGRWCYDPVLEYRCDGRTHILRQPVACVDVLPVEGEGNGS